MEERGKYMVFAYPEGELLLHKDLSLYCSVSRKFGSDCAGFLEELDKKRIDEQKIGEYVCDIIDQLKDYAKNTIIPSLAKYGIYDATVDDFVVNTPAYNSLLEIAQQHLNLATATISSVYDRAELEKKAAFASASSSITGPGFGVISNDPIMLGIYAAKSEKILNKQVADAEFKYSRAVSRIDFNAKSQIDNTLKDNIKSKVYPSIVQCIGNFFSEFLTKYCEQLAINDLFDINCLQNFDLRRSNGILENLGSTSYVQETISSAKKACPFNFNVYCAMVDNHIKFSTSDIEIVNFLGIGEMVTKYVQKVITDKKQTDVSCNNITAAYLQRSLDRVQYEIALLKLLTNTSLNEANLYSLQEEIKVITFPYQILKSTSNKEAIDFITKYIYQIDDGEDVHPFNFNINAYDERVSTFITSLPKLEEVNEFLKLNCSFSLSAYFTYLVNEQSQIDEFANVEEVKTALQKKLMQLKPIYSDYCVIRKKKYDNKTLERQLIERRKTSERNKNASGNWIAPFLVLLLMTVLSFVVSLGLGLFCLFGVGTYTIILILLISSGNKLEKELASLEEEISRNNFQIAQLEEKINN